MRLSGARLLAVVGVVLAILACGGGGASVDPAFQAYKEVADKILQEYDTAMNDVAAINNALVQLDPARPPTITPDIAVDQLERVFIPKLTAVAKQANELATPDYPELTAAHKPLAAGLTGKLEGYRGMVDAYKKRDAASFDRGFKRLLESDATVKRYRSYLQKWSEQGRITELPADAAAAAAPAAPAAAPAGGVPGLPPVPGGPTN